MAKLPIPEAYKALMSLPEVETTLLLRELQKKNPDLLADLQAHELTANLNCNVAAENADKE